MTRRADPANLAAAQREGRIVGLMRAERLSRETAEMWERAWLAEATRMGRLETDWDYWELGLAWIARQRGERGS